MRYSRSEFFAAIAGWRGCSCVVHLHTDEISGAFVAAFLSASGRGVLEFVAHPMLETLTVDLSNADEFELVVVEREVEESELVGRVADEIALARVPGKMVFSMARLVDPLAGPLVRVAGGPALGKGGAEVD